MLWGIHIASAVPVQASGTYPPAPPKLGEEVTRAIDPEVYNLGKSIYVGRAQLSGTALSNEQIAHKRQTLEQVVGQLPERAGAKLDVSDLASRLSEQEEAALLYYLKLRFRLNLPVA